MDQVKESVAAGTDQVLGVIELLVGVTEIIV